MRVLLASLPSLPVTHDTDVFYYAIGGTVLLLVGAFLVRWASRRKP